MNKSESKYFNTARLIDKAFIEILSKKDISYITVKEICEKAGVNRSTFYLHYETINDLLEETLEYIQKEFDASFNGKLDNFEEVISDLPLEKILFINKEYLVPYLRFVKGHKHVYKAAVNNPACMQSQLRMASLDNEILKPIFTRFNIPENEHKYWSKYYINGVMAIVFEWLKDDCKDSIEFIVDVIEKCVRIRSVNISKESGDKT